MPAKLFDEPIDLEAMGTPQPLMSESASAAAEYSCTEDVVISGLSCRLPESDNIAEFRSHLINEEDMVTDSRRWQPGLYGLPDRCGTIKDISKFDASFFGVHPKQADSMDPQLRMLLEVTQEALIDAGVNPHSIRGTKTGVFIGTSASECHEAWSCDPEATVGYSMTGCTRSMFANRLSYFFDFKGPSYAIDTACSSSLLALDQALLNIRTGRCDAAIVGGASLCIKPTTALQFMKLGMLSTDGMCKSFDESGNGYCRSEGIVAIYIQKVSEAKRVYSTILHAKNNADGNKEQGITFPSGEVQKQLLKEVYIEAAVDPSRVAYVEAHGTGTKAGDPQEVNAITDVFCKGRQGPLLIGSTKSNMGHPEPASGLAAVCKVVIAAEDGMIPANLHYKNPNPDIPGLLDGRLEVVAQRTKWDGGLVGVNSFGFGGSNVHVLLKTNTKPPSDKHTACDSRRLFVYCSRNEEGLNELLNTMKEHSHNIELQALLNESACLPPASYPYRGYTVLNSKEEVVETQKCLAEIRPVWFVFAGMGTQWYGMGKKLMELEIFKKSIDKSDSYLEPYRISLYDAIMNGDEKIFEDTIYSFVGIAAIQVALVDALAYIGVRPDGIVGHSVGELGCAYADGSLTAEETVLAAYWRGHCIKDANLPPGSMAAVGLTWEEAKAQCPAGVVPACHNAKDTVTVSGPSESVAEFVKDLKAQDIFAKEVQTAGVAFHSYYMADIAPLLKTELEKVITPKLRSSRWISSSIPESNLDSSLAKYSSADYHVNNLVSPVLFQEALQSVPHNSIVIEIAPHCLLQAILKRSLGPECCFAGLMKRNHPDNMEFFYTSLGKCYMNGLNLNPMKLHQSVTFPVSRGTPMISPLVKWDHTVSWDVPTPESFLGGSGKKAGVDFEVNASPESEDHYLIGHTIDGRLLFPATGYLVLAWRALAKLSSRMYEQMPVVFEDINIHRATILPKTETIKFEVEIMQSTGDFEICENGSLTVSGRIYIPGEDTMGPHIPTCSNMDKIDLQLTAADVYKELRLRGYDYGPTFQGILGSNIAGDRGELLWNGNWVSFLDTLLQMSVVRLPGRSLRLPTRIKYVCIDPVIHIEELQQKLEQEVLPVTVDPDTDTVVSGGVKMLGLHATVVSRRPQHQDPVIEDYKFVPYEDGLQNLDLTEYSKHCCTYAGEGLQNLPTNGNSHNYLNSVNKFLETAEESVCDLVIDDYLMQKDCSLMSVLSKIFTTPHDEDFSQNVKNIISSSKLQLQHDKLVSCLQRPQVLKPCLDIVLENVGTSKIRILEIETSYSIMYRQVINLLNSQPTLLVDYTASDPSLDRLNTEELNSVGVNTLQWDPSQLPSPLKSLHLIIANNVLHRQKELSVTLSNISASMADGAFLLVQEVTKNFHVHLPIELLGNDLPDICDMDNRTCAMYCDEKQWNKNFSSAGFELICKRSDGFLSTLFLLRKIDCSKCTQTILSLNDLECNWFEELKVKMKESRNNVWLVADQETSSGIVGMVNCLKQETGGENIRCIFNASLNKRTKLNLQPDGQLFQQLVKKDLVMNVYRDGKLGSFRHLPKSADKFVSTQHAYVNVLTRGDLSSLKWIESPLKYYSCTMPGRQLCHVEYASLNFRDIMLATGKLPPDAIPGDLAIQDCILGMEFSGRDPNGKRVMGLLPAKALATTVDADKRFLWDVPENWTMEQAATVPVVYATVYYALVVRGRIRKGDRVLIHSGSGGVGQAAISVALHHECKVFITVGSKEKREYLMTRFPQLQDGDFSNSRDTTFEYDILKSTKGKGVDVVLNSLAEEKLQASLRVLAPHGRFLEIGKYDLANNTSLGMSVFLKNISFHGILLDALFEEGNKDWEVVASLVTEGIESNAVKPLKSTTFQQYEVEAAFRYMAQGKHIGKVLIKVQKEEPLPSSTKIVPTAVIPRSYCHFCKTYIITGGLGGFGLELSQWLVERGARNLVLTSRSGIKTGYQAKMLKTWRDSGINVHVSKRNIKDKAETRMLLKEAMEMGPIGGIFHLAVVLRDGLMENQTLDNFQKVIEPKVIGTKNLDEVTREMCLDTLQWFVVFSSVSCGRGNMGQANYGYANSVMERICEQRHANGLPGLAIQWGAIGDVGLVLETMGDNETAVGGTLPQRMSSCLHTLDDFLCQSQPVVSSFVLAEKQTSGKKDGGSKPDLVGTVCHILGVKEASSVGADITLGDLGLDSLMGVEVKQALERDFELVLSMREIRQLTISGLKDIADRSGGSDDDAASRSSEKSNSNERDDSGIALHYDLSQVVPTIPVLALNDVQAYQSERPLFIVHPLEGVAVALETLASNLKCPVYGLQFTEAAPLDSIQSLATHYLQEIASLQQSEPYQIAGYSFGACVALEMALQLQASNVDATEVPPLILLDGSHKFVAAHTHSYRTKLTISSIAEAESEALVAFVQQFLPVDRNKLIQDLMARSSFEERIASAVGQLLSVDKLFQQKEDVEIAAKTFYYRLMMSENYEPNHKYNGNLLLIKASRSSTDQLGTDYGLTEICTKTPTIYTVDGDHESFIQGTSAKTVSKIVISTLTSL